MNEAQLAHLHDDLVNGKSRRGKLGGIGAGDRHSILLDSAKRNLSAAELARMPDRPLYKRFVLAEKKELCRHTVLSVLKANGGNMRWHDLVLLVAQECGESVTRDFKYRVLVNIPEGYLSKHSPIVSIPK